ncbi:magnetosome protein MamEO [Candidatus Magnetomorum sp. HK-1]|nr:magnetosome protein MamEO [Candidatus Magnetomorum sp. HK-1]
MKKQIAITLILLMLPVFQAFGYEPASYLQDLQESINQSIASVRPSIVNVTARKKETAGDNLTPIWYNSIGSGIIIDSRGYILSNYHVVENASSINVTLWQSGQSQYSAKILKQDPAQDLVVLSIQTNGEKLIPAQTGNSDNIEVGDWVISIGSPFGFSHSVSLGIVSEMNRHLKIGTSIYESMIQTDAVINQGNSGGPLVNINGMVVGVGTAIFAPAGTYRGLGFAIPINRAKHFYSRITGAIQAAAVAPANKIPVNLNKRIPNDAIHKKFSDCTKCHIISQKMQVSVQQKMNHPMVASKCSTCHILVNEPVLKGPTPVAAITPLYVQPVVQPAKQSFYDLFTHVIIKLIPVILISSIIFTMLGVGGGFLYVPVLLLCGIDFHTATSTSLMIITMSQLSALYIFYKSGLVDVKLIMILVFPTMIGAFLGGVLSQHFNVQLLSIMFACTLFLASYFMMKENEQLKGIEGGIAASNWISYHDCSGYSYFVDMGISVPLTFVVGYMGGMLGMGGGWLMVPIMVVMFNIPMKIAVAASSMMVPLTAFSGFLGHSMVGHIDIPLAVILSVTSIIGAQVGARLSIDTESNLLRFLFAFVLSVVGLWMIIRIF